MSEVHWAHMRMYTSSGPSSATDLYWGRSRTVWNNVVDTVYLYNGARQLVDKCSY